MMVQFASVWGVSVPEESEADLDGELSNRKFRSTDAAGSN